MSRRVVVTGMGTVNPLALNVRDYWAGLLAGRSGAAPLTLFDTSAFKVTFGAEVKNWKPDGIMDSKVARHIDRFAQFALAAAKEAVVDSGIDFSKEDAFRCGSMVGSGIGGLFTWEEQFTIYKERGPNRLSPFTIPKMIANSASGTISIEHGLMGPNTAVSTACSTAAHAIGDAFHTIKWDLADVMVTGGAEGSITPMGLGGFVACRALSHRNDDPQRASRPFDKDRDGFVLGEGAGVLVLEEYERAVKRGAKIYCEVLACGNTADAYHITAPHPEGLGAGRAMINAVKQAGWNFNDVDYINAHGTSTGLGDKAETLAVKQVFGSHARKLMMSSTKSMIGHLLGASGGVEAIACAMMLKTGLVHPTINLDTPDPDCDLDYVPNHTREKRIHKVLSNSFGFGGHNASLALGAI
ncbi:beta-ketoacyl-ACP synthase II [Zavarzinella formosa]|uniref:beta-ketoacyl-ACP synthase II n=1 Tax=Zavarzinella formosa TaxID=360055 RepID=UPI0002F7366C|nr:beta-ketoacyl-ACP synthase II [Zavarzinella formosa]